MVGGGGDEKRDLHRPQCPQSWSQFRVESADRYEPGDLFLGIHPPSEERAWEAVGVKERSVELSGSGSGAQPSQKAVVYFYFLLY